MCNHVPVNESHGSENLISNKFINVELFVYIDRLNQSFFFAKKFI